MTRRILSFFLLFTAVCVSAQQRDIFARLEAHPEYLDGTDMLCPTAAVKLTKAPKGYRPFYLSHYGRHDARYAWQHDLYKWLNETFTKAEKEDNLTKDGKEFKRKYDLLFPEARYRTGELSDIGWKHQQQLAERMYRNFPGIFSADASVTARSSTSTRCVMTMSSCCLALKGLNPKLDITEYFGAVYTNAVIPQSGDNPFRDKHYKKAPILFEETWEQYIERTIDYRPILGRLFPDVDKALPKEKQWDFVSYLYFLANGMNAIESDLDFRGLFTHEERLALWKIDDFQFYKEIWPTHPGYKPILEDIIAKADERIGSGKSGADLRFGHDYTFLPLLMLLGVDGYDHNVENPDDIPVWCQVHRVPFGANVHLVFYKSKKDPKILFKVLFNGEEAHLPLPTDNWPYYDWAAFKAFHARQ